MDINMKLHMSLNMNMIIMLHQRTLMTFRIIKTKGEIVITLQMQNSV